MKVKKSELKLVDFYLLEHHFLVNNPEDDEDSNIDDVEALFDDYKIDIDFTHRDIEEDLFQAFVVIKVNDVKNKKMGYSLNLTGVANFKLDPKIAATDKSAYDNLKHFSTVNIVINHLRNVIGLTTAFAPLGRYNLPAIDISDLFKQKIKEQRKKK